MLSAVEVITFVFVPFTAFQLNLVHGYADPLDRSGVCNNARDSTLIRRVSKGIYFRFSTGGKIVIHSASSAQRSWTYESAVMPACSSIQLDGNCDLWAPNVSLVGDTCYLYYSVPSFGSQHSAIGVATSKTLKVGSWSDLRATGIALDGSKNYNAIDANLVAADGDYYMTFGSFWADLFQTQTYGPPETMSSDSAMLLLAFDATGTHFRRGWLHLPIRQLLLSILLQRSMLWLRYVPAYSWRGIQDHGLPELKREWRLHQQKQPSLRIQRRYSCTW